MSAADGSRHAGRVRRLRAVGVEVVLVGLVAAYLFGLARPGTEFDPLVDGLLGTLTVVLPSLVLLDSVHGRRGGARRDQLLLAAGALCWSAGETYVVLSTWLGRELPFPSWADVGYLAFPVLVTAALVSRVRRELSGSQRGVWLDVTVGGLGTSCGLAVLLGPVIEQASGRPVETALALAYPLSDLVLVAMVVSVTAVHGLRPGAAWLWLMAGVGLFAVADVVYALRVTNEGPLHEKVTSQFGCSGSRPVASDGQPPRNGRARPTGFGRSGRRSVNGQVVPVSRCSFGWRFGVPAGGRCRRRAAVG